MQSVWFGIAGALVAQVQAVAATAGAACLDNPALPLDLKGLQGSSALFVVQRGDKVLDQPGQRVERRRMRVLVGAIALTNDSLQAADALHFAARTALRSEAFREGLRSVGTVNAVREVEIEPELKDVATEGSALMSAFEIDYTQTYPNAA